MWSDIADARIDFLQTGQRLNARRSEMDSRGATAFGESIRRRRGPPRGDRRAEGGRNDGGYAGALRKIELLRQKQKAGQHGAQTVMP